jgi:hypothetical protein
VLVVRASHQSTPAGSGIVATSSAPALSATETARGTPSAVAAEVTPLKHDSFEIRIEGAPKDAKVMAGAVELGVAPGPFTMKGGEPVTVTVVAKGYKPKELSLTPTANATLQVALEKQAAAPTGKAGGGSKGPAVNPELEGFDKK